MFPGDRATDADVVIVGCGPVGCTLAALLARRERRVIVLERDLDLFPLPRAAHFDSEIARVLQEIGVMDHLVGSIRVNEGMDFLTADREVLLSMRSPVRTTAAGWPASIMFHQPGFETALRDRARELGAEIRLGDEVIDVEDLDDHAAVRLADGTTIRCNWIVGCDGARSLVRRSIAAEMDDLAFEEPWLVLDLVLDDDLDEPTDRALQVCDPARPHTLVPMPAPRFRFEFMILPGERAEDVTHPEMFERLLAPWVDPTRAHVERSAVYTFHGLIARRWRAGRLLIAGDAAHQMPPFLGQGMCAGIRDAANLAWKLDRVLADADETLLDTYQREREPHVRSIVEAAIGFGRLICTTDPAVAAARDETMLAARTASPAANDAAPMPPLATGPLVGLGGGAQVMQVDLTNGRFDDVVGARFAVVGRTAALLDCSDTAAWRSHGAYVGCADDEPALTALLDHAGADVVVVRPDRYVLAAGDRCTAPPPLLSGAAAR